MSDLSILTREECANQLRGLGLQAGDTVLVRASLGALGPVATGESRARILIQALLDVIGPDGLLLGLAFSKNDWVFRFPKLPLYDVSEPCITGGFVAAMLKYPGAVRSLHPTNSFVAIGRDAQVLMRKHDETQTCFEPIQDIIDRGGKMMLIGCQTDSPGFSTVHLVQNRLHLDTKTWMKFILGRRTLRGWYVKHDVPGCSMGFGKFYDAYRQAGLLTEGKLGKADAWLMNAKSAYDVEYPIIARDPHIALCDSDTCVTCRLGWFYKPIEIVRFLKARLCSR